MKTIDKKDRFRQATSKKEPKRLLIDHPEGHKLLSDHSSPISRDFVAAIIDVKSRKESKKQVRQVLDIQHKPLPQFAVCDLGF
jgi:uncharacterized protein YneF (UPF0154 family)